MRKEKALTALLRDLVALLAAEADRNPAFGTQLDDLLTAIPERKPTRQKVPKADPASLPDLHSELQARGELEFRHWLREQPLAVMRASIRAHDLDPPRRTAKWKETDKLADFITDALCARLSRGSAFIGRRDGAKEDPQR
jgi:hypothetical protein